MSDRDLIDKAKQIRLSALSLIYKSNLEIVGSAMSSVELLVSLYYGDLGAFPVMNFDIKKPRNMEQDFFVLSKASATPVLYSILADLGFFPREDLDFYAKFNSPLKVRPDMKVPGVSVSSGVFGHGLSQAIGIALFLKSQRKKNKVFCLISLEELQSAEFWTAVNLAAVNNLSNLILIIDDNGYQFDGAVKSIVDVGFVQSKMDSFAWQLYRVLDGHDFEQILNVLYRSYNAVRKPVCLWVKTLLGKGVDFLENNEHYAFSSLSENEYNEIVFKLKKL